MVYLQVPGPNALFASSWFACLIYDESRYVHLSFYYMVQNKVLITAHYWGFMAKLLKVFPFCLLLIVVFTLYRPPMHFIIILIYHSESNGIQ